MHRTCEPAILYFGMPVVLISTVNGDGSYNLAPMSSAWWLGTRCVLGIAVTSKSPQNMLRTGGVRAQSAVRRHGRSGESPRPDDRLGSSSGRQGEAGLSAREAGPRSAQAARVRTGEDIRVPIPRMIEDEP